jgi:subtilisin family serine protease
MILRNACPRPRRSSVLRGCPALEVEALEPRTMPSATRPGLFDTSAADHVLVRFRPGAPAVAVPGTTVGEQLPLVPSLHQVSLTPGVAVADALAAYRASPLVAYAEPDDPVRPAALPDDPSFAGQWGLDNPGDAGGTAGADIHAPAAWDVTTGSPSVVVAVLDTGVDYTHPDLAANLWTNPGEVPGNGIDDDHNGYVDDVHGYDFANDDSDPMDDNGHGTRVAGILGAAGDNGQGIAGVAWHVQIMAVKFMHADGSSTITDAIRALDYAVAMGARVSNSSWGGWDHSPALGDALRSAREHGHLFVAAAGNNGTDNDLGAGATANHQLDNVVSVTATDRNDALAAFANWGATSVDLAAPGTGILSTLAGGGYGSESGTSLAAPFVSGAAALLLAADPSLTPAEVKERLLGGVDPIGQVGANAGKPTRTNGRLNVANSLRTDLSWDAVSAPSETVSAGQDFALGRTYRVSGSAAGPDFTIAYYRSADPIFGNGDDVLLGTETVEAADAKAVGRHAGTSPRFGGLAAGTYYLFARLDDGGAVAEFSEANQVSAPVAFTVTSADVRMPNERYLAAVYLDVLGRPVDPSGLAHWSGLLDGGVSRVRVVQAITHSEEYFVKFVRDAYQRLLRRDPDGPGLNAWVRRMQAGLTDAQLEAAFLGSVEYYAAAGGTDGAWVQALYRDALGRAADPSGEAHWAQRLVGGASRAEVALGVTASAERAVRAVEACYATYTGSLGRPRGGRRLVRGAGGGTEWGRPRGRLRGLGGVFPRQGQRRLSRAWSRFPAPLGAWTYRAIQTAVPTPSNQPLPSARPPSPSLPEWLNVRGAASR